MREKIYRKNRRITNRDRKKTGVVTGKMDLYAQSTGLLVTQQFRYCFVDPSPPLAFVRGCLRHSTFDFTLTISAMLTCILRIRCCFGFCFQLDNTCGTCTCFIPELATALPSQVIIVHRIPSLPFIEPKLRQKYTFSLKLRANFKFWTGLHEAPRLPQKCYHCFPVLRVRAYLHAVWACACMRACFRFWPAYYRISHIVTKTAITCEQRKYIIVHRLEGGGLLEGGGESLDV